MANLINTFAKSIALIDEIESCHQVNLYNFLLASLFWFDSVLSQLRIQKLRCWAVVVAELVDQSLLTPDVRGSNPVIGKSYIEHCLRSTVLERHK